MRGVEERQFLLPHAAGLYPNFDYDLPGEGQDEEPDGDEEDEDEEEEEEQTEKSEGRIPVCFGQPWRKVI